MKLFGSKQARQGGRERGVERRRVRPRLEALEDRTLPSTFTVLNTNDSGPGSLRAAVAAINGQVTSTNLDSGASVTDRQTGLAQSSIGGGTFTATRAGLLPHVVIPGQGGLALPAGRSSGGVAHGRPAPLVPPEITGVWATVVNPNSPGT